MLTQEQEREVKKICDTIAHAYKRKCWWADERDLKNVGWVAVEMCRDNYDGVRPLGNYFGRAIRRRIFNYLIQESSPVSSSWHDRFKKIGTTRVALDSPEAAHLFEDVDEGWADRLLDKKRRRVTLLARLFEVVGPEGRAGLEAMLSDRKRTGRVAKKLAASIALAQERIASDDELRAFWKDAD